jgi:hypothetical protein
MVIALHGNYVAQMYKRMNIHPFYLHAQTCIVATDYADMVSKRGIGGFIDGNLNCAV